MKFDVSSTTLLSHLQSISRVIASKNSLPILECFLFELNGNVLTITASDADTRLETSVEIFNVEGEGVFAVSSKILLEPLKELPEQPLSFDINDENLEIFIYFQNGKYNFVGQNGITYPKQKTLDEQSMSFTLESQHLLHSVLRTNFATADDDLRPVMNGVCFDLFEDSLTMVASDGHKLVRLSNTTVQSDKRASLILPKKPVMLLKHLLTKDAEPVKVSFDQNNAYITTTSFEMVCRLIEGRYPNYNSVIPKNNTNRIVIDRLSLLNALKRVSVFSNPSTSLVRLRIQDREMNVSAQDVDFATAAEERIVCESEGLEMSIGFKATYLIEILNNISSDEIVILLADATRAGLFSPAENEPNEELLMLLMPMMLNT